MFKNDLVYKKFGKQGASICVTLQPPSFYPWTGNILIEDNFHMKHCGISIEDAKTQLNDIIEMSKLALDYIDGPEVKAFEVQNRLHAIREIEKTLSIIKGN